MRCLPRDIARRCDVVPERRAEITPVEALDVAGNATWYAATGVLIAVTGCCPSRLARGDTLSRGDSLAPVYLTRWALVGATVLWCIACIAMIFTDTVRWQLRGQVLVNITVMAAAAGILVVFMRSAAARGAAGRLARELDTTPLSAGRLARSVRSALRDPNARLLFRDAAGTAWVDSDGRAVLRTEARSRSPPSEAWAPTTGEREVLALVTEGLTDGAIAQRLYLTRRTVETHIGHVFAKLGVPAGSSQNQRVHAVRRYLDDADESHDGSGHREIR
jgi:DNA-binding NarL/FixJ family response regulator